jgi:hypothetical protein
MEVVRHKAEAVNADAIFNERESEHREEDQAVSGRAEEVAVVGAAVGDMQECRALRALRDEAMSLESGHTP